MIHREWLYKNYFYSCNYISIKKTVPKGSQVIKSKSLELKFKVLNSNTIKKKTNHYTPISSLFLPRNLKWLSSSSHVTEFTWNIFQVIFSVPMTESSLVPSCPWNYLAKSLKTLVLSSARQHTPQLGASCSTVKIWGSPTLTLTNSVSFGKWLLFFCAPIFPPTRMTGRKCTSKVNVSFYITNLASEFTVFSFTVPRGKETCAISIF